VHGDKRLDTEEVRSSMAFEEDREVGKESLSKEASPWSFVFVTIILLALGLFLNSAR